jgi:hypothetical protein
MKAKSNGVFKYLKTRVTIGFPNEEYKCRYCPLLETYSRNQCRRTGEYILDINGIGYNCPLEIIDEEEERHES